MNGIGEDAFCIRRGNRFPFQIKVEMSEVKKDIMQGGAFHFHSGLHNEAAHIFHADICKRGVSFVAKKAEILPDHPLHIIDSVLLVVGKMDEQVQNTFEVWRQRFGGSFIPCDDAQSTSQSVFFQTTDCCGEIHKEYSRYCVLLILDSVGCKASVCALYPKNANVIAAVVTANDTQIP